MDITRFSEAKRYDAPKHFDVRALRMQGLDMSNANFATVALSHFLPGGGADMDAGATEKIYVVLEGEITITLGDSSEHVLRKFDSCLIGAGEARAVRVDGNDVATMLVVMPPP